MEKCSGSRGYLRSLLLLCGASEEEEEVGGREDELNSKEMQSSRYTHAQQSSRTASIDGARMGGKMERKRQADGRKWGNMKVDLSREPFDNNASTSQAIRPEYTLSLFLSLVKIRDTFLI